MIVHFIVKVFYEFSVGFFVNFQCADVIYLGKKISRSVRVGKGYMAIISNLDKYIYDLLKVFHIW